MVAGKRSRLCCSASLRLGLTSGPAVNSESVREHVPISPRDKILAVVLDHLDECSVDELRVMCAVAKRLEIGRARYGLLNLRDGPTRMAARTRRGAARRGDLRGDRSLVVGAHRGRAVNAPRIDRDVVLCALTPRAVLEWFGVAFRDQAGQHRTNLCAHCGERSRRDAVAVSIETGLWTCHVCGASGDVLALLAGYAGPRHAYGLPALARAGRRHRRRWPGRRFGRARAHPSGAPRDRGPATRRARGRRSAAARSGQVPRGRRMEAARSQPPTHRRRDVPARAWARRPVTRRSWCVRFAAAGDIRVPLFGFDGDLVNVVRRVLARPTMRRRCSGLRVAPRRERCSDERRKSRAASR